VTKLTDNNPNPVLTEDEIRGIREGVNGVKYGIPSRFYCDEAIYRDEVECVLKKNWLCVGRWDQVEKPGDYFTIRMWGESIIIVRDKKSQLHALINVCQHRWSQVVEDGSGNANLFMCPYHRWTYGLDGKLRGVSVQNIPGFDKKKCGMPTLRVEEWHGFIFVSFNQNVDPLAPQLKAVSHYLEKFQVGKFREKGSYRYQTRWNWKFSLETSYEGYHHVGLHHDRIHHIVPAANTQPMDFGQTFGSYLMWPVDDVPEDYQNPFGTAPDEFGGAWDGKDRFIVIYPGLAMYLNNYQCTYIYVAHESVDSNCAWTCQAFAPWAIESADSDGVIAEIVQDTKEVQAEDTFGCTMLQKGVTSTTNRNSVVHPLESQLNHFHNWYIDQFLKTEP